MIQSCFDIAFIKYSLNKCFNQGNLTAQQGRYGSVFFEHDNLADLKIDSKFGNGNVLESTLMLVCSFFEPL